MFYSLTNLPEEQSNLVLAGEVVLFPRLPGKYPLEGLSETVLTILTYDQGRRYEKDISD